MSRTYVEELITPDLARHYLTFNTHNRPLKPPRIDAYAEQIKSGKWRPNGEAIKFGTDVDGTIVLLDGQNRLHAIIVAGVSATVLVVRGLIPGDQETMDIGLSRKLNDHLSLRHEINTSNLAATIRALFIWDNTDDPAKRQLGASGQGYQIALTVTVLLEYFDANSDDCRHASEESERIRRLTRIPTSILAPLIREFEGIDPDDAKDFWHRLGNLQPSPRNLGDNDPLTQINKSLRRMFDASKMRYLPTEMAALIIKSWNAYRTGQPLTQLRWRSGGNAPEPFPMAK